jgi:(2Fe-2S) ferredoxin
MNTKYVVGAKLIESAESLCLEYCSNDVFTWYGGRSIYRFDKNMKPQDVRRLNTEIEMTEENIKEEMYQWGLDIDFFANDPENEWSYYKHEN